MFSLKSGWPIAICKVKGKKVILGIEEDRKPIKLDEAESRKISYAIGQEKSLTKAQMEMLADAVFYRKPPKSIALKNVYRTIVEDLKDASGRTIEVDQKSMIPIFLSDESRKNNYRLMFTGKPGSGKSHLVNEILVEDVKIHPKAKIFVFSALNEDQSLDKDLDNNMIRIDLDPKEFLEGEPMNVSDFQSDKPSEYFNWIIFDDIDGFPDAKVKKAVATLRDSCLQLGRHYGCNIITVSHILLDGKPTKASNNFTSHLFIFPESLMVSQVDDFLKKYMQLDEISRQKVMNADSRWVMISKDNPTFALTQNGGTFLP
jgi:hypothetical protein